MAASWPQSPWPRAIGYKISKRAILVALSFSLIFFVYQVIQPEPDFSTLVVPAVPSPSHSQNSKSENAGVEEQHSPAASKETKQHLDGFTLSEDFLEYLQTLDPIPKKVHMFFPDKDYWRKEKPLPFVKHSILSLKKLNPDWNVTVYDDEVIDDVIRKAADSNLIPREECQLLIGAKDDGGNVSQHTAHIVERSDIARLLLMYTEGGFYLDVDRLVSKRIEDVVQPNTRLCLPTSNDANFCQDLMCSSRNNKLFLSAIQEATSIRLPSQRRQGWLKGGSLFDLGPNLYNKHVVSHVFKGRGLHSTYQGGDVSALRNLLRRTDGLVVTKKETSCNEGLLVDPTSLPQCYDRGALYGMYGMKAWGPQVDTLWENGKKG